MTLLLRNGLVGFIVIYCTTASCGDLRQLQLIVASGDNNRNKLRSICVVSHLFDHLTVAQIVKWLNVCEG